MSCNALTLFFVSPLALAVVFFPPPHVSPPSSLLQVLASPMRELGSQLPGLAVLRCTPCRCIRVRLCQGAVEERRIYRKTEETKRLWHRRLKMGKTNTVKYAYVWKLATRSRRGPELHSVIYGRSRTSIGPRVSTSRDCARRVLRIDGSGRPCLPQAGPRRGRGGVGGGQPGKEEKNP